MKTKLIVNITSADGILLTQVKISDQSGIAMTDERLADDVAGMIERNYECELENDS